MGAHFPAVESETWSSLTTFPECQGSFGIVLHGPVGLVICYNIRQELKCKHIALTLTMWLLSSNCALPWTTNFFDVFSKTYNMKREQRSPGPKALRSIFSKIYKFWRSLFGLFLFHYIFDLYITCLTLSFNTIYVLQFTLVFLYLWSWTVNISAAFKSILSQSRCSLELKIFVRVLHLLKPLMVSQNTARSFSFVNACFTHFSTEYIHSWEHIWYLHIGHPI